ncbi:methylated-DNA--[protein]-cysteine S-methyltransferase [Radiobacillus kanasensis]|uniref:methylated-DNA--[protein]-cysteine S-methyltransferase n=1 Tax=Radiobacillus kanasensis TaxID=2844358 RepID=UPI001E3DE0B6|nr:methylated-DNA--[protein]-cysteine S-methyltransferase [Radiobacillus kanasensis]UFT99251.1 methylated-DNA--[protein]-cysteine S-methyltransferase [Radiobacillus kanasensis]
MNKDYTVDLDSPIGILEITGSGESVHAIHFTDKKEVTNERVEGRSGAVEACYAQLIEYFNGERIEFDFPYALTGTDFQKKVWQALTAIPYAEVGSYKDIAIQIGNEKAVRAVGSANGKNQIPIVVPCHRIIGANGSLTGYAGELWRKEWLLEHEKKIINQI